MKLLVLGSHGQLGTELCRVPLPAGTTIVPLDIGGLDITDRDAVFETVGRERPAIVVNAAAYTAVDRAESEPEAAFAVNEAAPGHLAAACGRSGIPMIHISTDYVFDGAKPGSYREDDSVNPLGVYGRSKEAGERAVRAALAEHVILRTAWLYSAHGHNFVKTMLRLAGEGRPLRVVADQKGSPTSAADLAGAILAIIRAIAGGEGRWGTFHYTGAGVTNWHGFAEAIVAMAVQRTGTPPPPVAAIVTADYPTPARRPANSALDCARIAAAYGIAPRPWQEALAAVVGELTGGGLPDG